MELELAKGTKAFSQEETIRRNYIIETLKKIFEIYGFSPLETPILQRYETLTAKYAGGSEITKEILGVLVTKTNIKNVDMPIKDIQDILEIPVICTIPEDRAIKFSQAKKDAVIHTHPESASSIQYKRLAAEILGIKYEEEVIKEEQSSIFKSLINWFLNR